MAPPLLEWTINNEQISPTPLRAIDEVRPPLMTNQSEPRTFAGVYEFRGLEPNTSYKVSVSSGQESSSLTVRTLPKEVTGDMGEWFNILLVSCYHWAGDKLGFEVSQIPLPYRPHMSILMGDQVYLDLPTLQDFKDDVSWLAKKFETDYGRNWRGPNGYAKILDAAPSVAVPDDHEYWNNYPHASPFIQNSYTHEGRQRWRMAAQSLYEAFQLPAPSALGEPVVIEVPPLSIFVSDMRTFRLEDRTSLLRPPDPKFEGAIQRYIAWVDQVIDKKYFGLFVTGQSLLSNPVSDLAGKFADYELSSYKDYPVIVQHLHRLVSAGREAICLTGDVHWGRVSEANNRRDARLKFYEVISSPASLVTTIGADQWASLKSWVTGLFGNKDPWPRHSEPGKVPLFFTNGSDPKTYSCVRYHPQKGNHVAILSFRQAALGLHWKVTYFPIHDELKQRVPFEINMPKLGPK